MWFRDEGLGHVCMDFNAGVISDSLGYLVLIGNGFVVVTHLCRQALVDGKSGIIKMPSWADEVGLLA